MMKIPPSLQKNRLALGTVPPVAFHDGFLGLLGDQLALQNLKETFFPSGDHFHQLLRCDTIAQCAGSQAKHHPTFTLRRKFLAGHFHVVLREVTWLYWAKQ